MVAVVGSRDVRIGFGLAGVKKHGKILGDARGEKIIILESNNVDEPGHSVEAPGAIIVALSLEQDIAGLSDAFVRRVVGANIIIT